MSSATDLAATAASEDPIAAPNAVETEQKALMEVMSYGNAQGWLKADKAHALGCRGLLQEVMEAGRWGTGGAPVLPRGKSTTQPSAEVAILAGEDSLEGALHRASESFRAAEEKLLQDGLICCEDWLALRDTFFTAGSLFALAGYPDAAAKCFLHATFINGAFKAGAEDETRMTLTQCVDNLKHLHPSLAVDALLQLATTYERSGVASRFEGNRRGGFPPLMWQAARCRKEAAELTDRRLDDHAAAIPLYEAAIDTFKRAAGEPPFRPAAALQRRGTGAEGGEAPTPSDPSRLARTHTSSRKFLDMYKSFVQGMQDRLGILYSELGEYEKAEMLFLEKAQCTPCGLPATRYYLYATLCVLVRGFGDEDHYFNSLYYTKKVFDRFQEMDKGFQKGKENELVRNILQAFDNNSLNSFDIALNLYSSYSTTQPNLAFDVLSSRCRQNLLDHLERYA
ncbi:unnamed protein product [Phytomonas sp. EM1]|nr:unnamed protein product [Phytomonas sp. EM1]|eukprot:CCW62884.1 unnamed protein product [Phytomonas sp. isolate EM1]